MLRFLEFEFDLRYRGGTKKQAADAMSRLPTDGSEKTKLYDDILVLAITKNMARSDETERWQESCKNYEEPTE